MEIEKKKEKTKKPKYHGTSNEGKYMREEDYSPSSTSYKDDIDAA